MVKVHSFVLAVIVLPVAGLVFGFVIVMIGATVFFLIINVFELVGHQPLSLILMITLVLHSLGVNGVIVRLFTLSVRVHHPFVEYSTAVLVDIVDVSFMLHVTDPA